MSPGDEKTDFVGGTKSQARPRLAAEDLLGVHLGQTVSAQPTHLRSWFIWCLEYFQKGVDCSLCRSIISHACKSVSACVRVCVCVCVCARLPECPYIAYTYAGP